MQLISYYIDPGEASAARDSLEKVGIAAELRNVDPHVMQPSKSGSERIGLFVKSDEQFEDAILCLKQRKALR